MLFNFCSQHPNTKLMLHVKKKSPELKSVQRKIEPVYTVASSHQTAALSPNLYN